MEGLPMHVDVKFSMDDDDNTHSTDHKLSQCFSPWFSLSLSQILF
jgi:hypothetical protein